MGYIIYYQGKDVVKKLNSMPVNIAYVSQKSNYAVFYGDNNQEKNYFNQVKNIKGFKKIETSLMFNEETRFVVK